MTGTYFVGKLPVSVVDGSSQAAVGKGFVAGRTVSDHIVLAAGGSSVVVAVDKLVVVVVVVVGNQQNLFSFSMETRVKE